MAWYSKSTFIRGYDTSDPGPAPGLERLAWAEAHSRLFHRSGHWSPPACLRAARAAGVIGDVTVDHRTSDLNGKGGGGIDRRFIVTESSVTEADIPKEENLAWSDMQSAGVWEDG